MLVFCASSSSAIQFLHYEEFIVFGRLLRKLPSNVQSQLSLHGYEELFKEAATAEECWRVLRQAGREFGFTHVGLQLGGRYFEEQTIASPKGAWKLSFPLSESDYVTLAGQHRPLTAPETGAQLAILLQRTLSLKAGLFESAPESDRSEAIPANGEPFIPGRPMLESGKSALLRRG